MAKLATGSKKQEYRIVLAKFLFSIDREMAYSPETDLEDDDCYANTFEPESADEILSAARQAFAMTYTTDPEKAVVAIRHLCVTALRPVPAILAGLSLPPVQSPDPDQIVSGPFLFVIASKKDLDFVVTVKKKKCRFLDTFENFDAGPLIIAIRTAIQHTFKECYNSDGWRLLLDEIRKTIHPQLIPFNEILEFIGIEPVAKKVRYRH